MARRLFDFKCSNNHIIEKFIDVSIFSVPCPACGDNARRQVGAPLLPMGVLGPYWAHDRAIKQAKEK